MPVNVLPVLLLLPPMVTTAWREGQARLGVPLLPVDVTLSAPDAVLVAHGSVPPVGVDRGSRKQIFCAVLPV
jgi:hypothetical protein